MTEGLPEKLLLLFLLCCDVSVILRPDCLAQLVIHTAADYLRPRVLRLRKSQAGIDAFALQYGTSING